MSIKNLEPLIVEEKSNSNIQIVCNYLKLLKEKKIDNFDLNIPNITPIDLVKECTENKTMLDEEIISQEECQKLIFDLIKTKINQPSYYQIKSLIDILANQFKKFNQNYYLGNLELL